MSISLILDVPALERLIGGDSAIEVEIRKGVVENFARKHFSAALKEKPFQEFMAREAQAARKDLEAAVVKHIGGEMKIDWNRSETYMHTGQIALINRKAEEIVGECVAKAIDDAWKRIEPQVDRICSRNISALVDERVKKLVEERLAEIATSIKVNAEVSK